MFRAAREYLQTFASSFFLRPADAAASFVVSRRRRTTDKHRESESESEKLSKH